MAEVRDIEVKETIDRARAVEVLKKWLEAVERKQDVDVRVEGKSFNIPATAFEKGRFRVEYEIEEGEYEFEVSLKWR